METMGKYDLVCKRFSWSKIIEMNHISKGDLVKLCGLDKYTIDYALPQQWLDTFVKEQEIDYHMVISTTVMLYGPDGYYRQGMPVSCCTEIQEEIDKYIGG